MPKNRDEHCELMGQRRKHLARSIMIHLLCSTRVMERKTNAENALTIPSTSDGVSKNH